MERVDRRLERLEHTFEPELTNPADSEPILDDALRARLTVGELRWLCEPAKTGRERIGWQDVERRKEPLADFPDLQEEFMRRVYALADRRDEILQREPTNRGGRRVTGK